MDQSLFLARLMGPTYVAIALGMLTNLSLYESMIAEGLHSGILFYLTGLLSLLAGLAIVNLHNTWCADWRVIITVRGVAIGIGSTVYGGRAPTIVVALIVGTLGCRTCPRSGGRGSRHLRQTGLSRDRDGA
jgi:hypothetical protein